MSEGIAVAAREFSHPGSGLETAVALVANDEFLFIGTVASNVRLGAAEATADELATLCTAVGLSPDNRPDTPTGISGRALSRGEARRLILLRVVLSQPDVLLIDEPDLGLDPSTSPRSWHSSASNCRTPRSFTHAQHAARRATCAAARTAATLPAAPLDRIDR